MKFSPPRFVADQKLYISDIPDGEEFSQRVETDETWSIPQDALRTLFEAKKEDYIAIILENTRGWFSKPLTA